MKLKFFAFGFIAAAGVFLIVLITALVYIRHINSKAVNYYEIINQTEHDEKHQTERNIKKIRTAKFLLNTYRDDLSIRKENLEVFREDKIQMQEFILSIESFMIPVISSVPKHCECTTQIENLDESNMNLKRTLELKRPDPGNWNLLIDDVLTNVELLDLCLEECANRQLL